MGPQHSGRPLRALAAVVAVAAATAGLVAAGSGSDGTPGAEVTVSYTLDDGASWQDEELDLPQVTCTREGGELRYHATGAGPGELTGTVTAEPRTGVVLVTLPDGRRFRADDPYAANTDGFAFVFVVGEVLGPGTDPDGPVLTTRAKGAATLLCP